MVMVYHTDIGSILKEFIFEYNMRKVTEINTKMIQRSLLHSLYPGNNIIYVYTIGLEVDSAS